MNKHLKLLCLSLSILLFSCIVSSCKTAEMRTEIEELKQSQQNIDKKLDEILSLLGKISSPLARPTPQGPVIKDVEFDIGTNLIRGKESAELVMIEFSDYECQYCGRYVRDTYPLISKQYIDKGAIRYAVVDNPLQQIHQKAAKAAEASHCAKEQGKYWEIHDLMMTKQESLGNLPYYAESLNLNISKFDECIGTGKYAEKVGDNMALAQKLGIYAVPGFVIGRVDASNSGKVTGISFIPGAMSFSFFQTELDSALASTR